MMVYNIHIITNDLQVSLITTQNLDVQASIYTGDVSYNKALKSAVSAYKKSVGTDPYRIGVSVLASGAQIFIVIHSKNGTGSFEYFSDKGFSLSQITEWIITEYITGEKVDKLEGEFRAYFDPIYTDLVYGQAVMHTNIDDNIVLFKDFALYSTPFVLNDYLFMREKLGYSPIIEFSAINKRGMEMDFLTYKSQIDKFDKYGYFVMKTPYFREKVEILRKRFTSGKITFIVEDSQFKQTEKELDWFNGQNVEFLRL